MVMAMAMVVDKFGTISIPEDLPQRDAIQVLIDIMSYCFSFNVLFWIMCPHCFLVGFV